MLEVEGLRAWASGQQRLRGVSFPLAEYDSLAMLGASGSGKSLTARGILGLPPRGVRYDGRVLFQGQNLLAMPAKQLSALHGKALSMIFQEPSTALNPVMRIGDQIAEPLTIHTKLSNQEQRRRVVELLDKTGLTAAGVGPKRFPHELSGGQRQRVAVAIALALSPAIVIADEPTSALDAVSAAMVLDLLFELAAEVGTAVIIITHDIDVARRARQTLVLSEGNVAELGPTRSVLTAPKSEPAALLVAGTALTLPPRERQAGKMVLSAERITVARGGAHVVREASFEIRAGERLALVGRSGSGKTSLSRAIVGLLPMSGRVML
ncbi:MAG: ATP-binding cassette domain-containing protein, partial [Pseudomonadota bacterium]